MDEIKGALQSRAVWGGIAAVGAGVAGLFGVHLTPDVQADIASVGVSAVSVIGGAVSIYGRVKATKRIGKR